MNYLKVLQKLKHPFSSSLSLTHVAVNVVETYYSWMERRYQSMTKNQIEFFKASETARNNRVVEALTRQRDANTYTLGVGQLAESKRHNLASESLGRDTLAETRRSNVARETETTRHNREVERLGTSQLAETMRANRARESIDTASLAETQRANQARERISLVQASESRRHNLASEAISMQDASTRRDTLEETKRSNIAKEQETKRSNLAREAEATRSARAQESLASARNAIQREYNLGSLNLGRANLSELARSNVASEQLRAQQQAETRRANLRQEGLTDLRDTRRAIVDMTNTSVNYTLGKLNLGIKESELEETKRANVEKESQGRTKILQDWVRVGNDLYRSFKKGR